ncbi:MAG: hypothetical protein NTZ80_01390 [Patescibacteria group bacterium]|nr:hypothetical protein [Patescibacteria group bacterium]
MKRPSRTARDKINTGPNSLSPQETLLAIQEEDDLKIEAVLEDEYVRMDEGNMGIVREMIAQKLNPTKLAKHIIKQEMPQYLTSPEFFEYFLTGDQDEIVDAMYQFLGDMVITADIPETNSAEDQMRMARNYCFTYTQRVSDRNIQFSPSSLQRIALMFDGAGDDIGANKPTREF